MAEEETEKKKGRDGGRKKAAGASASDEEPANAATNETTVEDSGTLSAESDAPDDEILGDRFWRFVAMVAFALLAYFALLPYLVLAAMQFGVVLMTGEKNPEAQQLLSRLAKYIKECLDYVGYQRDEMPFPFGPLPPAD